MQQTAYLWWCTLHWSVDNNVPHVAWGSQWGALKNKMMCNECICARYENSTKASGRVINNILLYGFTRGRTQGFINICTHMCTNIYNTYIYKYI